MTDQEIITAYTKQINSATPAARQCMSGATSKWQKVRIIEAQHRLDAIFAKAGM